MSSLEKEFKYYPAQDLILLGLLTPFAIKKIPELFPWIGDNFNTVLNYFLQIVSGHKLKKGAAKTTSKAFTKLVLLALEGLLVALKLSSDGAIAKATGVVFVLLHQRTKKIKREEKRQRAQRSLPVYQSLATALLLGCFGSKEKQQALNALFHPFLTLYRSLYAFDTQQARTEGYLLNHVTGCYDTFLASLTPLKKPSPQSTFKKIKSFFTTTPAQT